MNLFVMFFLFFNLIFNGNRNSLAGFVIFLRFNLILLLILPAHVVPSDLLFRTCKRRLFGHMSKNWWPEPKTRFRNVELKFSNKKTALLRPKPDQKRGSKSCHEVQYKKLCSKMDDFYTEVSVIVIDKGILMYRWRIS